MTDSNLDRKTKVFRIFLEHPGGLKKMELWKIVEERNICARGTLDHVLEELVEKPYPLVAVDAMGNYTLGLFDPVSQLLKEDVSEISAEIDGFLKILFEFSNKSQKGVCYNLGVEYLESIMWRTGIVFALLSAFFYDRKTRELWTLAQEFVWETVFQRMNDLGEKFYGTNIDRLVEFNPIVDSAFSRVLEEQSKQLNRINARMEGSIHALNLSSTEKEKLIRLTELKPFTQFMLKEKKYLERLAKFHIANK